MRTTTRDRNRHFHRGIAATGGALCLLVAAASMGEAAPETAAAVPTQDVAVKDVASKDAAAKAAFSLQKDANREASAAQKQIESLDDEAQQLLSQYRTVVTEAASYESYSKQLEQSIESQRAELGRIEEQMGRAGDTARDVLPLTARLIDDLDQFIALDVPFQITERTQRIAGLRELMNRADVSLSEKYRRVIEAYLIELEFGRTMEVYEGVLATGSEPLTVDFLRIGRVALLYQTPDGKQTGYWDQDSKSWVEAADYERAFKKGARVATKQDAPDLIVAPVHAPKEM